jgi:hypothetical protein
VESANQVMSDVKQTNEAGANESKERLRWQNRLLPFMMWVVAILGIFFCAGSLVQLNWLNTRLGIVPDIPASISSTISAADLGGKGNNSDQLSIETRARILLEAHTLQRRYHQAQALLLTRIWTKNIGFLTGMIMALVGATFILGKLREDTSTVEGAYKESKLSFNSTSPGLILTLLGTAILLASLFAQSTIEVGDAPVYLNGSPAARLPTPAQLPANAAETTQLKDGAKSGP